MMDANGHENLISKFYYLFHTTPTKCNCIKGIPFHSLVISLPVKQELNRKRSSYLHLCIPLIVCYNSTASSDSKVLNALFLHSFEKDIFMLPTT